MERRKISKFGVFCRRLRLENRELLYDMAQKLGVSSAFLSKVENGRGKPPREWREKLITLYQLDGNEVEELDEAIFEAENRKSIDISRFSDEDKELIWSFARKLNSVDRTRLKQFLDE